MNISKDESLLYIDSEFSRLLKLSIFVSIDLISIPLNILIIYYLYKKKKIHRNLSDDVLILLILISLTDILFHQSGILIYFKNDFIWPKSNIYCIIWNYFSYFDYYLNVSLTVWGSIERHIIIFHHQFFDTNKKRLFFHKFPIILIFIYGFIIYIILIILNKCENNFNMLKPWCGGVCFTLNSFEYLFDWIINNALLVCLILLLNIILIIRVIKQKNRIKQNRSIWYKCRKLTIQMVSISSIYLICFLPSGFIQILKILLNNYKFGENILRICFQYTFLLANSLLPFVTLTFLPDLRKKIKFIFKKILPILNQTRNIQIKPMPTQIQQVIQ